MPNAEQVLEFVRSNAGLKAKEIASRLEIVTADAKIPIMLIEKSSTHRW
jgi:hypothetical protein